MNLLILKQDGIQKVDQNYTCNCPEIAEDIFEEAMLSGEK